MAIQMRRGLKANLDTSRLVAGEIVVATDTNEDYVAVAKAPSDVIQLATKDELDGKVDAVSGKGLSTNDYTNADKTIVGGVTSGLASKVDKVTGKGLSTNDYTDSDKTKVGNAVTKSSTSGLLKNDGTVDTSTYLTSIPTASTNTLGGVKVDGSTITISNGVISSHSSGGSTVVPNPQGTASTDLTKIGIDGTNYNIPTSDTTNCYKTNDTAETTLADDDKVPFYDTSASGKRSSTWSNIKAKLKSYFDTLYTGNTGTVTSVSTGAGLTGGAITGSGTIKAKLKSETQSSLTAASKGSTADREYAVGLDASGNLSVNVPWTGGSSGTWVDITNDITFASGFTNSYSKFYRNGNMVVFVIEGTFSSYDPQSANYIVQNSSAISPVTRFDIPIYVRDATVVMESSFKFGLMVTTSQPQQKGSINVQGTTLSGEVDVYGSGFFVEA